MRHADTASARSEDCTNEIRSQERNCYEVVIFVCEHVWCGWTAGDTAVAVHPEDPRYSHLVGQRCAVPLTDRHALLSCRRLCMPTAVQPPGYRRKVICVSHRMQRTEELVAQRSSLRFAAEFGQPADAYQSVGGCLCVDTMAVCFPRTIPIVADTYVDREFGTGALKITPGHDPNDFEIGQRLGLPVINVMNNDGTFNANAGRFDGLDRSDVRRQLWAELKVSSPFLGVRVSSRAWLACRWICCHGAVMDPASQIALLTGPDR